MRTSTMKISAGGLLLSLLWGCGGPVSEPSSPPPPPAPEGPQYELLTPQEHLVRASMVLRGVRPTPEDLAAVRDDPEAVATLVDAWLDSPQFGETIKDMVNEWLLVRADVVEPLPAMGPLEGRLLEEMSTSLSESPLELARHVVVNDLPLTEIVTADYALADETVSLAYGLPYDPSGDEWQLTQWQDGRPTAGLLSDSELWRRHESAGSNNQRLRANLVADVFLCSSFATRDVTVEGGITISDEFEVAEAVATDPLCISCHQGLDPLAAFFFGFKKQTKRSTVSKAYRQNCSDTEHDDPFIPYTQQEYCYPIELYTTEEEDDWDYWNMRPPGFYGQPGEDLVDLGQMIAADPRFSQCMARRFYGYFTETDPIALDLGTADELRVVLEDSDFSAKALARAVVMSEPFRAVRAADGAEPAVPPAGALMIRPEQYARMVGELTGFTWTVVPDLEGCDRSQGAGTECWGEVDLMRSDMFGFRAMSGGINSYQITAPTHSPTPPRELVAERFASEAAGFVVRNDLATIDPASRRLLHGVEADTTDPQAVRAQVTALVERVTSRTVPDDDPLVSDLVALFADKVDRTGSTEEAWSLVLTALLLDPDVMFF